MTQSTFNSLKQEVEAARSNVSQSLKEIGLAAGSESDWHDNAAFDHANIKHDVDRAQLGTIEARLRDVEIIKPRKQRDQVDIGNSVLVQFSSENETEMYTILGPADSGRGSGWISYESPLGSSLMGRRKGDTVNYSIQNQVQRVSILDILAGNF